jgi:Domain of unknown function DUF11
VTAALFAAPAVANAAVTIGETTPGGFSPVPCVGPYLAIQTQVGDPPGYTVPAGGGVITSWSIQEKDAYAGQVRLKVLKPLGSGSYQVVGQSRFVSYPPGLDVFQARIPVHGGDTLGLWIPGDPLTLADCVFSTNDSNDQVGAPAGMTEPQLGDTFTTSSNGQERLNVSAQVEPDVDGDGYGDETQDRADLSLSLSAPSHATTGALVQYHLRVRNAGFGGARRTVLVDRLPPHAQYVGASNPAGVCAPVLGGVACQLGLVRRGSSVPITIIARVRRRGNAVDTAGVSSATIDPRSANNLAAVVTSIKQSHRCKKGFRFDNRTGKCAKAA